MRGSRVNFTQACLASQNCLNQCSVHYFLLIVSIGAATECKRLKKFWETLYWRDTQEVVKARNWWWERKKRQEAGASRELHALSWQQGGGGGRAAMGKTTTICVWLFGEVWGGAGGCMNDGYNTCGVPMATSTPTVPSNPARAHSPRVALSTRHFCFLTFCPPHLWNKATSLHTRARTHTLKSDTKQASEYKRE